MFDQLIIFASISTGLLGLLIIILMIFSYKSNIYLNIHLVIIFFLISLRFIIQGVLGLYGQSNDDLSYLNPIYLIAIPSFYLYFKSLLKDYKHAYFKDLYHYIFPLAMILFTISQRYFSILNNRFAILVQFVSLIIFIIFYLGISFNLIYNELWKRPKSSLILNRHYQLIRNWVGFIFIISVLLGFRLLSSLIIEGTSNMKWSGYSFSIIANILWVIIFGKILLNPEILYGFPKLEERLSNYSKPAILNDSIWNLLSPEITNLQDSTLKPKIDSKIEVYLVDIQNYISCANPFRDPNFSLKEIAKELNIPISHLAYIFKYHCNFPFVEFKKHSRIKDTLGLINNGYLNTMTLEAVAERTGFNSYNSFYVAFKKETGLSPKNYLATQNKNPTN